MEHNTVGTWEAILDENEDVQRLKGSAGYTLIKQ